MSDSNKVFCMVCEESNEWGICGTHLKEISNTKSIEDELNRYKNYLNGRDEEVYRCHTKISEFHEVLCYTRGILMNKKRTEEEQELFTEIQYALGEWGRD